jgi:methionyl-tRNA synthetase
MNKFYITTPIYYVNSRPHIGHAYTTIAADILARYYRLKLGNENVWFLTGTDEHGAKIAQAAEKEGKDPQTFADEVSQEFRDLLPKLNIKNDDFIRTTEERHETIVKEVLLKIKEAKTQKGNDVIYKGNYEGLYCVGCESYKKEDDLVDGKCPDHNTEPKMLSEENWYFRLSDFADIVKEKIESGEMNIAPDGRRKEVLSFLEQGLEDVAISRQNLTWGIPVPFDTEQVIYVWVDALINYISALGVPDDGKFKKFWPADVHLLAKDILKFHCVIWPAMLIAAGIDVPKNLFVHGYFTIDGKKMSKTLGNVIDPLDLVAEYGADAARYLIVSQFQFGSDGDVKADEFITKYNSDLANGVGNLVNRVLVMADKYCGGKVPDKTYNAKLDLGSVWKKVDQNYSEYKIHENITEILDVIKFCDQYIDETKPWSLDKEGKQDEIDQIIYNLLEIIRNLGQLLKPYLPEAGDKILAYLNQSEFYVDAIQVGGKVEKGAPLFLRKDVKAE